MKTLINLSNHNSANWDQSQKEGWDRIIDIQFPNVDHESTTEEVVKIVKEYAEKLAVIALGVNHLNIMLQGEFTFCYIMFDILKNNFAEECNLYIPTTQRVVQETIKPDGSVEKKTIFKFAKWRII